MTQFDIGRLDAMTAAEAGRPMKLLHPSTGLPFKRADGEEVHIVLLGQGSAVMRACQRSINDERAALDAEGRTPTPEQLEGWDVRYLVEATRGWNFDQLDGGPFDFNAENARKFWADGRFRWLRPRAYGFINETGNFLGG
jgi:hypothetical protein